jgi:acetyl esterase/lipase
MVGLVQYPSQLNHQPPHVTSLKPSTAIGTAYIPSSPLTDVYVKTHQRINLLFASLEANVQSGKASFVMPLWQGIAPLSQNVRHTDMPTLIAYLPAKKQALTSAVIICPGGGYASLSVINEGINEAEWFQKRGMAAFVLKYRLPVNGYKHPVPLLDAQRAIRLVRHYANTFNINPSKIGIMGFSAGGHVASSAETHFDTGVSTANDPVEQESSRPDFSALIYPVVSLQNGITHAGRKLNLLGDSPNLNQVNLLSNETQVTPETPPTVLVHAINDTVVPIENSQRMFNALQAAGVPSAFYSYTSGGHGFGFGLKWSQ